LPVCRVVFCALSAALWLVGCSGGPEREDVIAQARPNGQVAFDVVKINDTVVNTLLAQKPPAFDRRFKRYVPPPELKIAIGDTLSIVIWESADDGLFGNSLTELAFPAGAAAAARIELKPALRGVSDLPGGLTASPDLLATLYAGAAPAPPRGVEQPDTAAGARSAVRPGESAGGARADRREPTAADRSSTVEQLLALAEQSGRPGTRLPDQPVGPDGAVSIPYAGRIAVAGRTPQAVQQTIEHALADKALDPQVLVVVKRSAANSVSVAGEVVGGKRVPLSPGGDRLLDVIAAAGGAHAPVHDTFVRLSRGGTSATVPLATLVAEPDQDIFAEPGDVLTLVRRPQTFSVFGATGKNAAITFTSDRMSLSEALAKAGGLDDNRADPRAVFLFRYEPDSVVRALGQPLAATGAGGVSPVVYRLDLKDAASYPLAGRFPVHDKDIIFVADAAVQPLYHFFQALSQVTGPIQTGLVVCNYTKC
jgi:polysaccharide export outer membrane protein